MKHRIGFVWAASAWIASLLFVVLPSSALAAFHLMEIEQAIGGVGGDATAQAVQLKMRIAGQNLLNGNARLVVHDAAGNNPVVLSTFPLPNPANTTACVPILLSTPSFSAKTSPSAVANYTMNAIPSGYLAAGSLTFETLSGTIIYWRLSWGDGGYTGAQNVQTVAGGGNDDDGTAAPAFGSPLPSTDTQAVHFTPACGTASTTNSSQYALTGSAAVFTNNANSSFTVQAPAPVPGLPGAARWLLPGVLGLGVVAFAVLRRRLA